MDTTELEKGYFSPIFAKDLINLSNAYIYVGDLGLFVNEDIDYANKLINSMFLQNYMLFQ